MMQEKKEELSWYSKLKLSEKYKLNAISGAVLAVMGILIMSVSGHDMTHHLAAAIHSAIGAVVFLAGLWLYAAGMRYQAQLDAIRISRKNKGFKRRPKKNE